MRKMIEMIYLTLISLFTNKTKNNEPKKLNRKTESKKMKWNITYTQILFIIIVILILTILVFKIYQTGSLESTGYYYRING